MPNPFFYLYIKYMVSKHILLMVFLNESEFIYFAHSEMGSLISM